MLDSVAADASVERYGYHKLSVKQLNDINDAEAKLELSLRMRLGIGVEKETDGGWQLLHKSALQGHPVALGFCFGNAYKTKKNTILSLRLFRESAERGHAMGTKHTRTRGEYFTRVSRSSTQFCSIR
jgi:hypothetical protein